MLLELPSVLGGVQMSAITCKKCGGENQEGTVVCFRCKSPLPKPVDAEGDTGGRPDLGAAGGLRPEFYLDRAFKLSWVAALVVAGGLFWYRHPCVGLWADLAAVVAVTVLLAIAFQIPWVAGYPNIAVGAISALVSFIVMQTSDRGLLVSVLAGVVVGFLVSAAVAAAAMRFQKKPWLTAGLAGAMLFLIVAMMEYQGRSQPQVQTVALLAELPRMLCSLVCVLVALGGYYWSIHRKAFGSRLCGLHLPVSETPDKRVVSLALLISGIVATVAGVVSATALGNVGLAHASMFALTPLALILLSGATLSSRLARLDNLLPGAAIFAGLVYIFGTPGWSQIPQGNTFLWQRSSQLVPVMDGLVGLGFALNLTVLLICRDLLLSKVEVDVDVAEEEAQRRKSRERARNARRRAHQVPRRLSPQWIAVLACVFIVGVSITVYSTSIRSEMLRDAVIDGMAGEVQTYHSASAVWTSARRGHTLSAGDSIRTGDNSFALVRLPGKNAMRVDPSTQVTIQSMTDPAVNQHLTHLFLQLGRLWADVNEKLQGTPNSSFEVQTPTVVGAVRGTQFSAQATGDAAAFSVNEGFVEVASGKESAMVQVGNRCVASATRGISQPTRMSIDEALLWKQRNRELSRVWASSEPATARNFVLGILGLNVLMGFTSLALYGAKRIRQ